jgi:mannose-6-phosphate isomerase
MLEGRLVLAGQDVSAGTSLVLPADLPEVDIEGAAMFLLGYIPDLENDVVRPLRAAGCDQGAIRGLGLQAL